jgi:hypothetical protein
MIQAIKAFFITRAERKRDTEFRMGFLHALDRRLFSDADPMLQHLEEQRLHDKSESFRAGTVWGDSVPVGSTMAMYIEQARRSVVK